MQATSAGLDVQLKILQALPSLLQNYASDLQGNLLVTALNICFTLQSSKNAIVSHTSAATLQQLVVSVFDKVVAEDSEYTHSSAMAVSHIYLEAASDDSTTESPDGQSKPRPAALDAYRVCHCLSMLYLG